MTRWQVYIYLVAMHMLTIEHVSMTGWYVFNLHLRKDDMFSVLLLTRIVDMLLKSKSTDVYFLNKQLRLIGLTNIHAEKGEALHFIGQFKRAITTWRSFLPQIWDVWMLNSVATVPPLYPPSFIPLQYMHYSYPYYIVMRWLSLPT